MGIPNSAFSRLCAALRTPMALFSSSSSGWLRGWLQQVLVKQSARSFDQYIFDTQSIGEKKKQTAKPPKPQTKHKTKNQNTKPKPLQRHRAVIQCITTVSLLQRRMREEGGCFHLILFFTYFASKFASTSTLQISLIHMEMCILIPMTALLRKHVYESLVYPTNDD